MSYRFLLPLIGPALVLGLARLLPACSNSDSSSSGGPTLDAAADSAPITVYDPDAEQMFVDAACNSLPTTAAEISTTVLDDAEAPVASGGTMVDGTYTLTALDWYNGDPLDQLPPMASTTLVISGGGTAWQTAGTDSSGSPFAINYAVVVDGAYLTLNESCPDPDNEVDETYTATATEVTVLDMYEGEPYVRVYTRQ